ncbi:hypothetical protein [Morganella morganii]|uniref:hypothetical protein n=1 Tax=Morganella TaxID=581 RepID=UPI00370AD1A9
MKISKHTTSYLTFNTSVHLLLAYENIALTVNKKRTTPVFSDHGEINIDIDHGPTSRINISTEHAGYNLALLNLNAAIVEGTLRQLFSSLLKNDGPILGALSKQATLNNHILFKAYQNIMKANYDIELNGGWDKLKNEIFNYTNLNLNDCMPNKDTFQTLFTLRNATAHGTALISPNSKMTEDQKDFYPYIWQNRLNAANIYTSKKFNLNLFDALNHPDFAKHFMDETIIFMQNIKSKNIFTHNDFLLTNFERFTFGKISGQSFSFVSE